MNLPLGVLDVATGASGDSKVEPIEPVASEPVKGTDPPIVQNKSLKEEKKETSCLDIPCYSCWFNIDYFYNHQNSIKISCWVERKREKRAKNSILKIVKALIKKIYMQKSLLSKKLMMNCQTSKFQSKLDLYLKRWNYPQSYHLYQMIKATLQVESRIKWS